MPWSGSELEHRVLVVAPVGRDGELVASALQKEGIRAHAMRSAEELGSEMARGVGAVILTEEALTPGAFDVLSDVLAKQPPWSDLPIVLLTTSGDAGSRVTWDLVRRLEPSGNVSLLERPLRAVTLVSAVHVALRARRRQYEVRNLHRDLERRVQERTEELQRLNQEAEGFNYSISHDLRTPLRAIVSTSRMLLDDYAGDLPNTAVSLLERQAEAAKRLAILIDDLLHLSRLSRQELRVGRFDFTALARQVAAEVEADGEVCFDVQEGLEAQGDELLVRFVLLNLFQNAKKFTPNGGVVRMGRTEDGTFYVRDHGIGFDMRYAAKLFLPFERLVRDDEFPGTGIGLANVKRIVERHGGRVWAESQPGQGATFFFTLGPYAC